MKNLITKAWMAAAMLLASSPAFAKFEPVVCQASMSQTDEIAAGQQYAAQVYQQQPVLAENDPVTKYIQALGARLVAVTPRTPGMTTAYPFSFHVVASEEINAFALPGGAMFVNLGLIQAAENEAQLAGVMAHELSHVVMRHSVCNLQKEKKVDTGVKLGGMAARMGMKSQGAADATVKGAGLVEGLAFLRMSRDDEKQADLLGVNIAHDARYDPNGMPQFFEIIQAKYGAGGNHMLSDHPNPGNRQEYTKMEIATLPPLAAPVVTTPAFTKAKAVASTEKTMSASEMKSGAWKGSGLYASGPQ